MEKIMGPIAMEDGSNEVAKLAASLADKIEQIDYLVSAEVNVLSVEPVGDGHPLVSIKGARGGSPREQRLEAEPRNDVTTDNSERSLSGICRAGLYETVQGDG